MKKEYTLPSLKVLAYEAEQDLALLSGNGEWDGGDTLPTDPDFDSIWG